jgi:hypothetical protein
VALQQMGIRSKNQCKSFTVSELIITPLLKPAVNRMKLKLGMPLQLAKDSDVAGIAYLFRKIGCVKNIFWFEVSIFFCPL